jgi:hypothetical protein
MITEDIDSKDCAQSYTNEYGWAIVSHECEYEAWTTENRFKRVYHLAPCENIVVCEAEQEASLLAAKVRGRAVPVGVTPSTIKTKYGFEEEKQSKEEE